ncbi:CDP-glucose 4,6-dehydratase [Accumulibacter sp.]|uniref:CDP-glucose 4,6-dehydratase n=1 Tax=Accumulibacter sp. TaxID=2053492 RepID=UPI001ACE339D|nr:CDP-glucose 4,6-dehydratase [Accumulibacter sp.]MBN8514229.1 CDP-glucose 4,6-dehydratase [Accumulibacter sp.]MBO3701545.1 CDP-glucose 4,6-dehydratase [Accumulibacter sp.]
MSSFAIPTRDFWRGKRVLVTGHTGFKGAWLTLWLHRLGARVTGISLPPTTQPNLFSLAGIEQLADSHFCDIRAAEALSELIGRANPEVVFHLAAQALVRASYRDPLATFATNVQGTANVLDALRPLHTLRVVVAITTDKVYQNLEHSYPYRETDVLGGHDPYSASKAAAEVVIGAYRDAYLAENGVAVAAARAGNVIGGGDWAEDRLIPDAIRAWDANQRLHIRRPQAIRPWQHVLEPLAGYVRLAESLWQKPSLAGAYNFGPETHAAATVRDVVTQAKSAYGEAQVAWGDGTEGPHEAGWLALEIAKARALLGVHPRWSLTEAVQRTVRWYRRQDAGVDARVLCEADLSAYGEFDREPAGVEPRP